MYVAIQCQAKTLLFSESEYYIVKQSIRLLKKQHSFKNFHTLYSKHSSYIINSYYHKLFCFLKLFYVLKIYQANETPGYNNIILLQYHAAVASGTEQALFLGQYVHVHIHMHCYLALNRQRLHWKDKCSQLIWQQVLQKYLHTQHLVKATFFPL